MRAFSVPNGIGERRCLCRRRGGIRVEYGERTPSGSRLYEAVAEAHQA
ncbi:hypothetical protein ACOGYQ_000118 [Edwardsiella piscicida]|nr:hypothetical protein [Edwardsiella piscicida]EKS7765864.1 hypothetical protein [Edwardsiella piscicida]UBU79848.1 hypothetical protein A9797_18130 [Edwardsiella piscicida]UCQ29895.1 hypothetical protein DCF74_10340 [Edwardsiella piscicida]UCQ56172.1 hypothetical protein DCF40_10010 [Edwardsiella piscicida]